MPSATRHQNPAADNQQAVASAAIEGGQVSPRAQAVMDEWAAGRLDADILIARIRALHEAG